MRRQWTVQWFDAATCRGEVVGKDAEGEEVARHRFHSTSFQADNSLRWPRAGEHVEVIFNRRGELLSVHGK